MYLRFELTQNSKHDLTEPPYYSNSLPFSIYIDFICATEDRVSGRMDRIG